MKEKSEILGNQIDTVSSVAEYLTFNTAIGDHANSIELRYEDENIWLTQKMMAEIYDVDVRTINEHLQHLFRDFEIDEHSVIRNYRITASDGKNYNTKHYNLQAIIAVGFKVNSQRAVHFRKWVGEIAQNYAIKGWVMDVSRLKNTHKLTDEYFEQQLERIREIRLSERKFYQKVTDIYITAIDYDKTSKTTRDFFALVQNKLHFAVNRHTAAETIIERADAEKENMGLVTWELAPGGKIQKYDVSIAKNYLSIAEMEYLERIVTLYLEYAELQALNKIPMTMEDWANRLDGFIEFNGREILTDIGKISHEEAKLHAETEFEKYRIIQDSLYRSDFDLFSELETKTKEIAEGSNL